ncbi:unnamed protein product [Caenorhabditis angaria]|uniref:DUF4783 domain-containing protein n=1 Tax=Caenorhabditis angaria TaxID=860376 RepID=A0A9P1MZN5_9PELO|nr:unnamed protein product [Caenorhabditis angaria]
MFSKIIVVFAIFGAALCFAPDRLAVEQANVFENAFDDAYRREGVKGIAVYFTEDFKSFNIDGNERNKTQYLEYLLNVDVQDIFFHPSIQATFDLHTKNLLISYHYGEVLYVFTLKPNRALKGGYQIKKIAPAY